MKKFFSLNGLSGFLLFFSLSFIAFFYQCTNAEYNLNQQIDRGYISRNAIFFEFDDPSQLEVHMNRIEFDMDGNMISSTGTGDLSGESVDMSDKPIKVDNAPDANGQTLIMQLLSGGKGNYFAAVHTGTGRYVYYQGDIELPPLTSGRFFTSKECLSDEQLAVIGKNYTGETFIEGSQTFIKYQGKRYQVIGTAGLSVKSTLDSIIFLNLGSVSPKEQMNGRFYIDGDENTVSSVFRELSESSSQKTGMPLKKLTLPITLTDIVSGGVYMKNELQILVFAFLVLIYISILSKALMSDRKKIGAMLLVGVSGKQILWRTYRPLFLGGLAGILASFLFAAVSLFGKYFYLPTDHVLREITLWGAASFLLLLLWLVPLSAYVHKYVLQEALRES